MGIFVARVHGLGDAPLDGVASLGRRPTIDDSGRVLLETHVFDWPAGLGSEGGYGKLVRVELLAKLRDEARYDSLEALAGAIRGDAEAAHAWLAAEAQAARRHRPPDDARSNLTRQSTPARHRGCRASAATARTREPIARPPDVTRRSALRPRPKDSSPWPTRPPRHCQPRSCDRLPQDAEPARHAVPDARRPAQARAGLGQGLERRGRLQAAARGAPRPAPVRAARRSAVRERPAARRPRRQQDPEGHDRQGAPARRLRLALHPGLGLPRPADREPDREDLRPRPAARPGAGEEPRLRHRADRPADGRLQARRRARRLGPSVPDHGLRQRGRRDPGAEADHRARLRLPRPEAGALVLRLRLLARRVRDRVRRPQVDHGRRRLPRRRPGASWPPPSASPPLAKDAFAVIWTTTPWTLPANQALNLNPQLEYSLVDTERGLLLLASALVEKCLARFGLEGRVVATALGEKLEGLEFRHPLAAVHPGYDRVAPVYLADYATAEDGTGIVHSAPAYGIEDFNSCRAHGLAVDAILNPVQGNGVYEHGLPLFGGEHIWKANPLIVEALRAAGRLFDSTTLVHSYPHCWRHKTPVIYRAAAQWFVRMDEPDASTAGVFAVDPADEDLARDRARCDRRDRVLSGERPRPAARHDRPPARLVHQPAAQLGRAAAAVPAQDDRRAASRHAGADRPRRRHRRAGRGRGLVAALGRRGARRRRRALRQEQRHPRRLVRLRLDLLPRPARQPSRARPCPTTTAPRPRPTSTSRATTSTAAGSTRRC